MIRLWDELGSRTEVNYEAILTDYIAIDDSLSTNAIPTLNKIAEASSSSNVDVITMESDEEMEAFEEKPPITGQDARKGFHQLRQYMEENYDDPTVFKMLDRLEDTLTKDQLQKMQQPKISNFFVRQ